MRPLFYECKKIFSFRMILIVMLFSFLFYHLFLSYRYYPNISSDMVAEKQLCDILIEQTGNSLSLDNWNLVKNQKEKSTKRLDQLVKENQILKSYHISTYQQLRNKVDQMLDEISGIKYIKEIDEEADNIIFGAGMEDVFLLQQIDEWEINKAFYHQTEKESEKTFHHFFENEDVSNEQFHRYIEIQTKNDISLLPSGTLLIIGEDFPLLAILMVISCTIIILPYFINEKNQNVYQVSITSQIGRHIYFLQWKAALLVSCLLCVIQLLIYFYALSSVGILSYLSCPTHTINCIALWYDMKFGLYLLLYGALLILLVVGSMNIIILLSRVCTHYMIACGLALPILYGLGFLYLYSISYFLIFYIKIVSDQTLRRPIFLLVSIMIISIMIIIWFKRKDKRLDIL